MIVLPWFIPSTSWGRYSVEGHTSEPTDIIKGEKGELYVLLHAKGHQQHKIHIYILRRTYWGSKFCVDSLPGL